MSSAVNQPLINLRRLAPSHLGLVGQTSASWGIAGGLVATLLVCAHIVIGGLSSSVGFLTATLFFAVGATVGFLHGALLAYLGRPADVSRRTALGRLLLGAGYSVPTLTVGWVIAMLLVLSALSLTAERYLAFLVTIPAWIGAAAFLGWAVVETRLTLEHLHRRWPADRALLMTLLLAFLALMPVFIVARPEIWIIGVRPTPTAAAIMALAATAWIVGPLLVFAGLAVRAWRQAHPRPTSPPETHHGR